jgi:hypothetical protein
VEDEPTSLLVENLNAVEHARAPGRVRCSRLTPHRPGPVAPGKDDLTAKLPLRVLRRCPVARCFGSPDCGTGGGAMLIHTCWRCTCCSRNHCWLRRSCLCCIACTEALRSRCPLPGRRGARRSRCRRNQRCPLSPNMRGRVASVCTVSAARRRYRSHCIARPRSARRIAARDCM